MAIQLIQLRSRDGAERRREHRPTSALIVADVDVGTQRLVTLDKLLLHRTYGRICQVRAQHIQCLELQAVIHGRPEPRDLHLANAFVPLREVDKHSPAIAIRRRISIVHASARKLCAVDDRRHGTCGFHEWPLPSRWPKLALRGAHLYKPVINALERGKQLCPVKWPTQHNRCIVRRVVLGMIIADLIDRQHA